MKKKIWIIIACIVLVVAIAVVVVVSINKNNTNNNSNGMNVQRDESVDIGPIRDNFGNNLENLKDSLNKTE